MSAAAQNANELPKRTLKLYGYSHKALYRTQKLSHHTPHKAELDIMSNRKPGCIKIGKLGETPVFLHWSFLIGCIFVAIFFKSGLGEVFYVCSAYSLLIITHELSHALAAHTFSLKVISIELSGIGGMCRAETPKSRPAALIYASAGIIMQLLLLIALGTYINYNGWPTSAVGSSFAFVFTVVNSLLFIINLIPAKVHRESYGSDGYLIWKLIQQFIRQQPYSYPDTSVTLSPKVSLLNLHGFVPKGFKVGVEILNDNTTTMEFVVGTLIRHLKLPHDKAVEIMLTIHNKGGVLIPLRTYDLAKTVSSAISDDAKQEGYKLVCRPIDIHQANPANANIQSN